MLPGTLRETAGMPVSPAKTNDLSAASQARMNHPPRSSSAGDSLPATGGAPSGNDAPTDTHANSRGADSPVIAPAGHKTDSPDAGHVAAVVVTFHPDPLTLGAVIDSIRAQVAAVLVVDNTEDEAGQNSVRSLCTARAVAYHAIGANKGVGHGHNVGIAWCAAQNFDYVVLLDQDSVPAANMVATLGNALAGLRRAGERVAAVGAAYGHTLSDINSFFLQFDFPVCRRYYAAQLPPGAIVASDCLISSGSLFPMDAIRDVGTMRADYFIDHVDTEWFLRARLEGYRAFGVRDAIMTHALGEGTLRFWLGHWRNYPIHVPERYYYTFRNSLRLYRERHAMRSWILFDLKRLLLMALVSITLSPQRAANLRFIVRGIRDGLRQKSGKLD